MNSLKCYVPGCRVTIKGKTGLDEINKLIKHYRRAHWANITMEEALNIRIRIEEGHKCPKR